MAKYMIDVGEDDPNWVAAGVSDEMVEAGMTAWDKIRIDLEKDETGSIDWDEGMIVAHIFKQMLKASGAEIA